MQQRRDFLKTIVLGSGAVFTSLPLSCVPQEKKNAPAADSLNMKRSEETRPPFRPQGQRYKKAHEIFREKSSPASAPSRTIKTDVVVVGSGISGLVAARQCSEAGFDVIIAENEPRFGGAAINDNWSGVEFPLGSVYFTDYSGYIREVLEKEKTPPLLAPEDSFVIKGELFHDFWRDSVINSMPIENSDKAGMKQFRDFIHTLKKVPGYPFPETFSAQETYYDLTSADSFIQKFGSKTLQTYIEQYCRSSMGGHSTNINSYSLLNFFPAELGSFSKAKRYVFPGGNNSLAKALFKPFTNTSSFLSEALCYSVEEQSDGSILSQYITETGENLHIYSKAIILAMQKYIVPHIVHALPTFQKNAISSLTYTPYLTVQLLSISPLLPESTFDTWFCESDTIFSDLLNPSAVGPNREINGKFVYSLYCPLEPENRSNLLDDNFIAKTALETAYKSLSLLPSGISSSKSTAELLNNVSEIHAWSWGHIVVQPRIGSHTKHAKLASRQFGSIVFANTDNYSSPAVENAVLAGEDAATKVKKLLRKRKLQGE